MKTKHFSLLILLFCVTGSLSAQGLYLRISPGIAMSAAGDDIGNSIMVDSTSETQEVIYGSYGTGFVADLDVGYMFSENLGVQLGFEYLAGGKKQLSLFEGGNSTQDISQRSNQVRLNPELVVSGGSGKITPYGRFGVSIPLSTKTIEERMGSNTPTDFEIETEFISKTTLGYRGAIGVNWSLGDQLSIFGEIAGLSQRARVKSSTVTKWVVDDVSVLETASTYDLEKNYVETIDNNSNNTTFNPDIDSEKAEDLPVFPFNLSSVTARVGVSIQF